MTRQAILYEAVMAALALVAVVMLIVGPIFPDEQTLFSLLDLAILLIFAADYLVRLARARRKGQFVLSNIPDLIAVFPFSRVFRAARLLRLARFARLARFSRALRLAAFALRVLSHMGRLLRTNGLHYMLLATLVMLLAGAGAMFAFEFGVNPNLQGFDDALWWSVVTLTTVGYGDIAPVTAAGSIPAVVLMVFGIGFVGMPTAALATYFLGQQARAEEAETLAKA